MYTPLGRVTASSKCSPVESRAWAVSAIKRMKRNAAKTIPTLTATTMSKTTVRPKHTRSTATSARGATLRMWKKFRRSDMFQATRSNSAANEAIGK